jgi:hypothetical protein
MNHFEQGQLKAIWGEKVKSQATLASYATTSSGNSMPVSFQIGKYMPMTVSVKDGNYLFAANLYAPQSGNVVKRFMTRTPVERFPEIADELISNLAKNLSSLQKLQLI